MDIYLVIILLNGILGIAIFEWAWKVGKPFREVNEERDSKVPEFRRYDAKLWEKWKFYPGAISFLPAKMLCAVLSLVLSCGFIKLITLGAPFQADRPLTGMRKRLAGYSYVIMRLQINQYELFSCLVYRHVN